MNKIFVRFTVTTKRNRGAPIMQTGSALSALSLTVQSNLDSSQPIFLTTEDVYLFYVGKISEENKTVELITFDGAMTLHLRDEIEFSIPMTYSVSLEKKDHEVVDSHNTFHIRVSEFKYMKDLS